MKRLFAILLAALMLPAFASAEVTANAVAQCCDVYQLTAPYSGVLKPFDWQSGEVIGAGETLFEMETLKVCAPVDGVRSGGQCDGAVWHAGSHRKGKSADHQRQH